MLIILKHHLFKDPFLYYPPIYAHVPLTFSDKFCMHISCAIIIDLIMLITFGEECKFLRDSYLEQNNHAAESFLRC
jgi:hypothetical protein